MVAVRFTPVKIAEKPVKEESTDPQVCAGTGGVDRVRQGRVGNPSEVGGAAGDEEA